MIMAAPRLVAEFDHSSKVIVISDDDYSTLYVLPKVLREAGFRYIFTSPTTKGTLHLVERLVPDLVFTDMAKSDASYAGECLARIIRGNPAIAHVPMVLSSCWPEIRSAWLSLSMTS